MPFAKWPDFSACLDDMMNNGKSEDSAKRICGAIQARVEEHSQENLQGEEKVVVEQYIKNFDKFKEFTVEEMNSICPTCAEKMKERNITKLRVPLNIYQWESLPEGWTDESLQSFWDSIGGSVTKCIERISEKVDDPAAFCSSLKDRVEGSEWRHEKKTKQQEVKTYADLECEIFAAGTWNKDKYSEKDLKEMVSNFEALKDTVKPPAKIGHSESQDLLKKEGFPAAGWVDKLKLVGNKIVATFKDVPKVVKDLIDKKAYKRVSAEIYPSYREPSSGKIYKNVLRAVAFLGSDIPAVENLSDVQALYAQTPDGAKWYTLDINDFNKKEGGETVMGKWRVFVEGVTKEDLSKKLTDALGEGVKVNVEDEEVLSEEERKKKEEEEEDKNKEIKDRKIEELTQQYQAVTKLQGDKDKEIADLKAKIAELEAQLRDKEASNTDMMTKLTEIERDTKSEAIKSFVKLALDEGKVLPKDEKIIVALMEQLDDKAVLKFTQEDGKETSLSLTDTLKKFISELPKKVEFREISPQIEHKVYEDKVSVGGVVYDVKNLELVQKAEKYAQDNKVEFDIALMAVSKEEQI